MKKVEKKRLTITPDELQARRERLSLSISRLAYLLAVEPSTVLRWEKGETVIKSPAMLAHAMNDIERKHKVKRPDSKG